VEDMVAAPNGDIWKTSDMQERLELHLQESYKAYQDTVNHMEKIMKKTAKDFRMDHSERVRSPHWIRAYRKLECTIYKIVASQLRDRRSFWFSCE
jgi:hypothetical protein